jgi:hypothetical protein
VRVRRARLTRAHAVVAGARRALTRRAVRLTGYLAGEFYAALVEKELDDQRASKGSIEQRALAVVSTSGVLVALLLGLATLTTSGETIELPDAARLPLYVAVGAFAAATLVALIAAVPFRYRSMKTGATYNVVRDKWNDPPPIARRRVTVTRLMLFESYKRRNSVKGWILTVAIAIEFAAVALLALAVALIIRGGG